MFSAKNYGLPKDLIEAAKRVHEKQLEENLKKLEIAANNNKIDKIKIFEIYKQIPFNLNTLINAKDNYQTLDDSGARALIYQKY